MNRFLKIFRVVVMLSLFLWFAYTAITFTRSDEILLNWVLYAFRGSLVGFIGMCLLAFLILSFNALAIMVRFIVGNNKNKLDKS